MTPPNTDPHSWTDAQRSALAALQRAERLILTGHVRPDGDCLGSQGALARALEQAGKTVHLVNPDLPSARYEYLARDFPFRAFEGELPEHDAVVLLDCNEAGRLGAMAELVRGGSATRIVVDHHPYEGEAWWDEAFLDPTAAATGCLVHRLARALDVRPDAAFDRALVTALVTDTGWFKYSNTDPETLAIASDAVARGLDTSALYSLLYQRNEPSEPRAIAHLLSRLSYHADDRLAVVELPWDADTPKLEDADVVLDVLRSVERVEVVLYLRELEEGGCKLSARSKTDFDVNRLARGFGGGGHAKASGATIDGTLDDVRARLVAAALAQLADARG